ncbi:MAG: hypothetical protein U1E42_16220 [Rhodospirillales bacterium]
MSKPTLFGHLASRFAPHPENLATEALHFVLARSMVAARAFANFLVRTGAPVRQVVTYQTQSGSAEGGTPDIIGYDAENRPLIIIENKFWAGLTDKQPVQYLEQLRPYGGLLLFVAPRQRQCTIWTELCRRVREAGNAMEQALGDEEMIFAPISDGRVLALSSWSTVLDIMRTAIVAADERSCAADLEQLQGLCEVMDAKAFLPLRVDELSDQSVALRMINYADLVRSLIDDVCSQKCADRQGLRPTHGWHKTGHYLRIGGYGCWLGINLGLWARYGITPLWASFEGSTEFVKASVVSEKLRSWAASSPPRAIIESNAAHVPIWLPAGVEEATVKSVALRQVSDLDGALRIADTLVA